MKRPIIFISVLIFSYLCGAFCTLSFDISTWSFLTRISTLTIGILVALAISTLPFIDDFFE